LNRKALLRDLEFSETHFRILEITTENTMEFKNENRTSSLRHDRLGGELAGRQKFSTVKDAKGMAFDKKVIEVRVTLGCGMNHDT
jgi:hypothetical protein